MSNEKALKTIDEIYNIDMLLNVGIYHRYENTQRIFLDEIKLKDIDLFLALIKEINAIIYPILKKGYFVFLAYERDNDTTKFSSKELKKIRDCGIKIPNKKTENNSLSWEKKNINYLFFENTYTNLESYLWATLSRNFPSIKPYTSCDIFFVSKNFKTVINIYDDRGMDILKRPIIKNNPRQ